MKHNRIRLYVLQLFAYKQMRFAFAFVVGFCLLFLIVDLLFPVRTEIAYSQVITDRHGVVLHAFLSNDDKWRMKTELWEVSPGFLRAIENKEDRWFRWHFGVNPIAIGRAVAQNILAGKKESGASTITMQVVRLLEPRPRTLLSKLIESWRATQLELHLSKDEILTLYITLLPYGGNIEGVKAASLLYFDRLPTTLSLAQCVELAVIPNKPTTLRIGESNPSIVPQRNKWLSIFKERGVFDASQLQSALTEPNSMQRVDAPKRAPHFAWLMKRKFPNEPTVQTLLSARVQNVAQTLAYNYVQRIKLLGIHNAAVVVVNNTTRAVEAYIGSPNFEDKQHHGEVDGTIAIRSPGSALKPAVYAMGFDKGLCTPKSAINDVPINFDGYAPDNFDKKFNGKVTVEQALAQSLNIPAVKVTNELGVLPLVQKLAELGFNQIKKDERKMGLSLSLGGCGVRLTELAGLYSCFANGGVFAPLKFIPSDTLQRSVTKPFSAASSFMITEILTSLTRPDMPLGYESTRLPKVAWKTGTSYGRRDAWSVGYNKQYTIAVWIGNFDGSGNPLITGASLATPLLFDIFNSLQTATTNVSLEWFVQPTNLDFRLVCAESGLPPNEFCSNTIMDYFIPTVSNAQKCEHLKEVAISADGKYSYCTTCLPSAGYKKQLYPNLAPDLIAFYRAEHIQFLEPPTHNPACTRIFEESAPKITSPTNGKEYIINRNDKDPMLLSCSCANDVHTVYWFVNDKLIAQTSAQEHIFFTPVRGKNKISCSDDKGRNSNVYITVQWE